jgi:protein SCO1/2
MLALLVPLVAYFIVQRSSSSLVQMPRHYLVDSVITKTERGKQTTDTLWHKIQDFSLVNQLGDTVSWNDMKGKVVVADFFFTRCPTICPALTSNMKRLQESLNNGQRVGDNTNRDVHFLSFSIDSERDSVKQLKAWADRFQINPDTWWLLTGEKKTIYDLAIKEMRIGLQDGEGVDTNFFHSDYFVLLDSNRYVRGYYHGLDSTALARLSRDMVMLTMERTKDGHSFLAGKLQLIAIVFLVAIVGLGIFLMIFRKKK